MNIGRIQCFIDKMMYFWPIHFFGHLYDDLFYPYINFIKYFKGAYRMGGNLLLNNVNNRLAIKSCVKLFLNNKDVFTMFARINYC